MKYVCDFVAICYVVFISFMKVDSCDVFTHILQGYFTGRLGQPCDGLITGEVTLRDMVKHYQTTTEC